MSKNGITYLGVKGENEDYIDMICILELLYMGTQEFLSGIKGVRIQYE